MQTAKQGSALLTLAQAWHAVSGYAVFVLAARQLGPEAFGDFGLVAWTMTTLETFVIAGAPRALSYLVASRAGAVRTVVLRGTILTFAAALCFTAGLSLAAPVLSRAWGDASLQLPLRIAALDFVAFSGFAALVQALAGLQSFARQATVWMIYSSLKLLAVAGLLSIGGVVGGILGYVVASTLGSGIALAAAWRPLRAQEAGPAPATGRIARLALPMACHGVALMGMLTTDLWAVRWAVEDPALVGRYVAASTLARVLYFVFVASGEALLPAVARALDAGGREAASIARDVVGFLLCLLLPVAGILAGSARPALQIVYGGRMDGLGYAEAAPFLALLAPAGAFVTLLGVATALLSAAGRAREAASGLLLLLAVACVGTFTGAWLGGPLGAATAACATAAIGSAVATGAAARVMGGSPLRGRTALASGTAGIAGFALARLLVPDGWWALPAAALLLTGVLALLMKCGALSLEGIHGVAGRRVTPDAPEASGRPT